MEPGQRDCANSMPKDPVVNDMRFDVIIKAADSCDRVDIQVSFTERANKRVPQSKSYDNN